MVEAAATSALFVPVEPGARYQVGEVIASGGMGIVYRGFDALGQRPVAYKRLRAADESARARMAALFQREFDTLTRLTHPSIVEAYDFGFDTHGPYYTMELLSEDLARLAPLPFREACRLMRDVASALALLHARRLVHRDVSPKNVCLTGAGRAKLIDFGGLTPFGQPPEIVGTPAFIAPECLSARALDQRTDLYALGALAYWVLTRHTHLVASRIDDLPDAWQEPLLPASRYVPELPKALDDLLLSLLQRQPAARPASAAEVIERLTAIAELPPESEPQRVAYSYLQRPPLVGREQVLSALTRALDETLAGAGQLVLLEGEQGLGRSALLDQLAVQAQVAGATVLRASGGLHTTPFSAVHQLVHGGLATFPTVGARMRERSSQFARLVGAPDSKEAIRSAIDASERQATLCGLLSDALFALGTSSPLVLLIDDSHAVDDDSLALLAAMTDMLPKRAMLLVLSARVDCAARDAQVRNKLEASALRLRLAALSAAQVNELVCTVFGAVPNCQRLAAWLHTQAGGNPAHTLDLTRLLLAQGAVRYTRGTFALPYEFVAGVVGGRQREALLASLSGASSEARELALLLALHDGALSGDTLASARGVSGRQVLLGLEELVQRGAAVCQGAHFGCASEALRAALISVTDDPQRRAFHRSLGRALARPDGGSLDELCATAAHLLQANPAEQFEGALLLARAAERHQFELGMMRTRLPLLEAALAVLERHGWSDRDCVGLLVPLSMAGYYGDIGALRRYLDRALGALSSICGLSLARRFRPLLGARLALFAGLGAAFIAHLFKRKRLIRHSFIEHLESLTGATGPATAAAACSFDAEEAWRVVAWLEPLAAAPKRSPLFFMYEFCRATAELVSGRFSSAARRYAFLVSVYERPVFGIDPKHAIQIRSGCLSGQAQALVTDSSPEALQLADVLERGGGGAFFAPHIEGVRATYYAHRGEAQRAAGHRARAEALSLQAGNCWSALSVLSVRTALICAITRDVVGLVRALSELEQLAKLSTSLAAIYELAQGHLELLRGQPQQAVARYERVFAQEVARKLPSYPVERSFHVEALSALGDHAAARALGRRLLEESQDCDPASDTMFFVPRIRLARVEARLGDLTSALELLDACFQRGCAHDNPLLLGYLHRERAYLAACAGDRELFERHHAAMTALFHATENPALIQQCDALRGEASRLGVITAEGPAQPLAAGDLDGQTELARPALNATDTLPRRPFEDAG